MKRQPYAAVALGLGTGGTGHWVTTKDVTLCNTVLHIVIEGAACVGSALTDGYKGC